MGKVALTMNGTPISGRAGMTILEVARENGIQIPTLCYLKDLSPIGACRVCVVELEGSRNLVGSCHTPIAEGMVIHTHSPRVMAARRLLIELMLANHPDNCLVCDAANRCELRQLAADLDIGLPPFRVKKHYYPIEDVSPYIVRDLSKCILCQRCVRACDEIAKQKVFNLAYRGLDCKVVVDLDQPINKDVCRDCDVCITLCPTGALRKPSKIGEEKEGKPLIMSG
jgi:NADP-reducing hydrogenase subunit HndD